MTCRTVRRSRFPVKQSSCIGDDGDGIFDINVDQLVDAQVTDIDGRYRFLRLTAGTYFLVQPPEPSGNIHPAPTPLVVTVVVTPDDAGGIEGIVLDEFDTYQLLQANPSSPLVVEGVVALDAVGDHRRLCWKLLDGPVDPCLPASTWVAIRARFSWPNLRALVAACKSFGMGPPATARRPTRPVWEVSILPAAACRIPSSRSLKKAINRPSK
jgi:hypothetical protein